MDMYLRWYSSHQFLTLTPGRTYKFKLSSSDMSSHPFQILS